MKFIQEYIRHLTSASLTSTYAEELNLKKEQSGYDDIILNNVVILFNMKVEDHIGLIGTCSECNKQEKIGLATDRGKDAKGNEHSPYLRCDDCVLLFLKKDGTESRSIT